MSKYIYTTYLYVRMYETRVTRYRTDFKKELQFFSYRRGEKNEHLLVLAGSSFWVIRSKK